MQRGTLENVKDDSGGSEGAAEPAAFFVTKRSRAMLQHARELHHRRQ
jgi:hypothetical protein